MKSMRQASELRAGDTKSDHHGSTSCKNFSDVYWTGPASMFGAVLLAVLLSLSHHFFYQSLNDRPVLDYALSQNQINNIAIAIAFLSKLMFVIASAIAYTQRQWLEIGKSEHRVDQVDTLTGIRDDITMFFHIETWLRRPILLGMAVVTWSLPIAAIFTPGTLTISNVDHKNNASLPVPQVIYNNQSAYVLHQIGTGYGGPTTMLQRLAMLSSTSGQILTIPSQNVNQSYDLRFNGSALRCSVAKNQGIFGLAYKDLLRADLDSYNYLSFVGGDDRGFLGTNVSALMPGAFQTGVKTLDKSSGDSAKIYVFSGPAKPNEIHPLIECQLHNATYDLSLLFKFPVQNITLRSLKYLNPVNATLGRCNEGFTSVKNCDTFKQHPDDHMSYQAIMDAFGQIIAGTEWNVGSSAGVQNTTLFTSARLTNIDWSSTENITRGLESLFQNITINAMSSKQIMKYSEPFPSVPVTVTTSLNIYVYAPQNLLLSYGISLIVTLICTSIGLHAMWYNRATYQNRFSTFLRAAWHRNPNIDLWILDSDRGADPLPKGVAAVKVRLGGANSFNLATRIADSKTLLNNELQSTSQNVSQRARSESPHSVGSQDEVDRRQNFI